MVKPFKESVAKQIIELTNDEVTPVGRFHLFSSLAHDRDKLVNEPELKQMLQDILNYEQESLFLLFATYEANKPWDFSPEIALLINDEFEVATSVVPDKDSNYFVSTTYLRHIKTGDIFDLSVVDLYQEKFETELNKGELLHVTTHLYDGKEEPIYSKRTILSELAEIALSET